MSPLDKERLSCRNFIKAALAGIGGMIGASLGVPRGVPALSLIRAGAEDEAVIPLGAAEIIRSGSQRDRLHVTRVNGWERTAVSYGLYVVRKSESEARVFAHMHPPGCRVTWHPDIQHYISPCHAGHFDLLGKNISGPPPRPLDEFSTKVENGDLFATLPPFKRTG